MVQETESKVVFRSEYERDAWWRMMVAVSTDAEGPLLDVCVSWADDALRAMRERFTPDLHLSPDEANALADAGYRFQGGDGMWVKPHGGQGVLFRYMSWCSRWDRTDRTGGTGWDRSQPLSVFLREKEEAQ